MKVACLCLTGLRFNMNYNRLIAVHPNHLVPTQFIDKTSYRALSKDNVWYPRRPVIVHLGANVVLTVCALLGLTTLVLILISFFETNELKIVQNVCLESHVMLVFHWRAEFKRMSDKLW